MICPNCGKEIPEGAKFCNFCGVHIGEAAPGGSAPAVRQDRETPDTTLYLVLAILSAVVCFLPTGIPAVVFAAKADSYREKGMAEKADGALRNARVWIVVSVAVGAVIVLAAAAMALFLTALIPQLVGGIAGAVRPFLTSI